MTCVIVFLEYVEVPLDVVCFGTPVQQDYAYVFFEFRGLQEIRTYPDSPPIAPTFEHYLDRRTQNPEIVDNQGLQRNRDSGTTSDTISIRRQVFKESIYFGALISVHNEDLLWAIWSPRVSAMAKAPQPDDNGLHVDSTMASTGEPAPESRILSHLSAFHFNCVLHLLRWFCSWYVRVSLKLSNQRQVGTCFWKF